MKPRVKSTTFISLTDRLVRDASNHELNSI